MLGWRIFKHALNMIFNDFGTALRVSSPLIAVSLFGVVLFIVKGSEYVTGGQGQFEGVLLLGLLSYIATLWVAVSWHRYCLLEEYPEKTIPDFNVSRILGYFGWGLLLGLILLGMVALLFAVVYAAGGFIAGSLSLFGGVLLGVGLIFTIWVTQRLSLVLPASAVGKPIRFDDSWRATRPIATAILIVFPILGAFGFAIGLIVGFLGVFSALLGYALQAIVNWMIAMVSLSVLTTMYGLCVEKRELA